MHSSCLPFTPRSAAGLLAKLKLSPSPWGCSFLRNISSTWHPPSRMLLLACSWDWYTAIAMHMPFLGADPVASLRAKSLGCIVHPPYPYWVHSKGVDVRSCDEGNNAVYHGRYFVFFISGSQKNVDCPGSFGKVAATLSFIPSFLCEERWLIYGEWWAGPDGHGWWVKQWRVCCFQWSSLILLLGTALLAEQGCFWLLCYVASTPSAWLCLFPQDSGANPALTWQQLPG